MRNFLAYITQPANLLVLLIILFFTLSGLFFWQEGGKLIMATGFGAVAVFLIGSYVRGPKKKP